MKKKEIILIILTLVLGGGYIWFFTDWFKPKVIAIQHTIRPYRDAWGPAGRATNSNSKLTHVISFVMNRDWKLNEVKVVTASEYQTNKFAHPMWHMVADKTSPATKAFVYGGVIPGMHPSVTGAEPDALQPGITYKLIVRSGTIHGEDDFEVSKVAGR
jgi:hypothetical protein